MPTRASPSCVHVPSLIGTCPTVSTTLCNARLRDYCDSFQALVSLPENEHAPVRLVRSCRSCVAYLFDLQQGLREVLHNRGQGRYGPEHFGLFGEPTLLATRSHPYNAGSLPELILNSRILTHVLCACRSRSGAHARALLGGGRYRWLNAHAIAATHWSLETKRADHNSDDKRSPAHVLRRLQLAAAVCTISALTLTPPKSSAALPLPLFLMMSWAIVALPRKHPQAALRNDILQHIFRPLLVLLVRLDVEKLVVVFRRCGCDCHIGGRPPIADVQLPSPMSNSVIGVNLHCMYFFPHPPAKMFCKMCSNFAVAFSRRIRRRSCHSRCRNRARVSSSCVVCESCLILFSVADCVGCFLDDRAPYSTNVCAKALMS